MTPPSASLGNWNQLGLDGQGLGEAMGWGAGTATRLWDRWGPWDPAGSRGQRVLPTVGGWAARARGDAGGGELSGTGRGPQSLRRESEEGVTERHGAPRRGFQNLLRGFGQEG